MPGNVLDENVVILRFDNSDFEKNTKQSMDTLDKLKSSMNDASSGESLKGLGRAANSIDLSGLSKSIETINHRFSTLGIAGMAVINKLTTSAMSSAKRIITSVPNQMIQGGWKRALNIEKAEFLMKGLGVAFEGTFDKATGAINGVKGAVLASVNQTRYGLDEAAKAASTLMASDERLKTNAELLAARLKAISGVAAVTSSDYESISYIFTKVAGQGRMMTNELNMLSMKGFNAAVEIQKYLNANKQVKEQAFDNARALGKFNKELEEVSTHATLTEADVRKMVSAGAIDFDIMSESLVHFFDTAAGANDTYEGSLANVMASFSRMGAQVEATKLKNLTKIFNYLLPVLQKFEDFIVPFTDKINEYSSKVTEFIGEGLINPIGKAIGLEPEKLFHGMGKSAEEAGKKIDKANKSNQKSSKKSREEILKQNKEYQAARDIWYKGTYGRGEQRKNALEEIGISYQKTQSIINQFYKEGFKWDNIETQLINDYNAKADAADKAAKSSSDANEKQIQQYPTMIALVKAFVNIVASVYITLKAIAQLMIAFGKAIKTALAPAVKVGSNSFLTFTERMLEMSKRFSEFVTKMTTGSGTASKVFNFFVTAITTAITTLGTILMGAKDILVGFFETVKEFFTEFSATEGFNALKEQLKDLWDILKEFAGDTLDKVTGGLGKLGDIGASSNMTKVVNFFSGLAGGLAKFINNIKNGVNPLEMFIDVFGKVKDSFSFKGISSYVSGSAINSLSAKNGLIGMIKNGADMLHKVDFAGTFGNATDKLFDFFDVISKKAKTVDFKGVFNDLVNALKDADWNKITKIGARIAGIAAVFKTVKDMGAVADAAVGTLGSISGFFGSLSNISNTYAQQIKINSFRNLVLSIAILLGAIVAVAAIPKDRLAVAMGGVLVLLGLLTAIVKLLNSPKMDASKLQAMGIAFAGIGVSVMLLATAMKMIAGMEIAEITKGIVTIGAFMAMFMLVAKQSGDFAKAGASFIAMAVAINLLITAVVGFAALSIGTLIKGGLAIAGFMAMMAGAARLASSSNPGGFVAMALALNILIPAIVILAKIPIPALVKGGIAIVGLVTGLAAAARVANGGSFKSLIGLSAVIATISASLVILSLIDDKRLIVAGSSILGIVMALAAASKFAEKSLSGIIAMSVMIGVISASIIILTKMDTAKAISAAVGMGVLAASLGIACFAFSKIPIPALLIALGGLTIALAYLGGVFLGLGKLAEKFSGLKGTLERGAELAGSTIGHFVGSIVSGFAAASTKDLPNMAKNLSDFMKEMNPFFEGLKSINKSSLSTVTDLAQTMSALGGANLKNSLGNFLGGGEVDFGTKLGAFANGFMDFSNKIKDVAPEDATKAQTVANVIKTLATSFGSLGTEGGLKGQILGDVDIEGFSDGIKSVVGSVKDAIDIVKQSEITEEDTALLDPVISIIKQMASLELPESGGLLQGIMGNTTIGEFGTFLSDFISGFKTFIDTSRDVPIDDAVITQIDKICQVIRTMVSAGSTIPPSEGLVQFAQGNTTINEFAQQLSDFIPYFNDFVSKAGTMSADAEAGISKVPSIAKAITYMARAANSIPPNTGVKPVLFNGKNLGLFGTQLGQFIPGFNDFASKINEANIPDAVISKIPTIAKAVSAMADLAQKVPKSGIIQKIVGQKDLGKFGEQLGDMIPGLKTFCEKAKDIKVEDTSGLTESIGPIATAVNKLTALKTAPPLSNLTSLASNVSTFVRKINKLNTDGLGDKTAAISSAVSSFQSSVKSASGTKGVDMSGAGKSMAASFAKGISGGSSSAKTAGSNLGKKAESGAKSHKSGMNSAGKDVGQGFVNGINAKKQAAYDAGAALGYKAKAGAKKAVNSSSPAKEFIKIGKYSGEGMVIGLKSYEQKVYKSGYSMGESSIIGANQGIADLIDGIDDPKITPVIDLSNVNAGLRDLDNSFSRNRAIDINSGFESSDYRSNKMMNDMVTALNKMSNSSEPATNYFTFNVDGAENPEDFANRFVRQVQLEMRTG